MATDPPDPSVENESEEDEETVDWRIFLTELFAEWNETGVPMTIVLDAENNEEFFGILASGVKQLKRIADATEAMYGIERERHDYEKKVRQ